MRTGRMWSLALLGLLGVGTFSAPRTSDPFEPREPKPLVIAHRGTRGDLPAHTLEGYAQAIELGADYVAPDLVMTRDGHLIARHGPNLSATTNVKGLPEFADRKRSATIDGVLDEGWFVSDFTLAEIKRLRAVPDFAERPRQSGDEFAIPTLLEIIELVKRKSEEKGITIGIYPGTTHSTYHQSIGLPMEGALVEVLDRAGWNRRDAPVFIRSFEPASLKALRLMTPVRLMQLVGAHDLEPDGTVEPARIFSSFLTEEGLREIRTYADGIGPGKRHAPLARDLIRRAHRHGLVVHAGTSGSGPDRPPSDDRVRPVNEYLRLYALGVDGVFSDFADTAVAARLLFRLTHDPEFARCFTGDDEGGGRHTCPAAEG